mgnify:CR=1 FL=1
MLNEREESFDEKNLEIIDDEPKFKSYKEKQAYYREKYENRGERVWVSKIISHEGKVIQRGMTYSPNAGLFNSKSARKLINK